MSGLDETLARWRRETEKVKPSAALMVELNALAVAQSAAPVAAPVVAAKAAGVTKAVVLIVAVALLGIAGAALVLTSARAPTPSAECVPGSTAVVAAPAPPPPSTLTALPISPATPAPAAPAAPGEPLISPAMAPPAGARGPTAVAPDELVLVPQAAEPVPAKSLRRAVAVPVTPTPARLVRAVEGRAMTCAAQRNELVELVREAAADDPDAAAAALTRWTLLCRALSGPALDTHRWFWPWAAPSAGGTTCNTVMTEPSCDDGDNIAQSIDAAARCVRDTTPGTCARRGALLQAVFASCEAFTHRPDTKNRAAVDEALSRLTGEFGAALAPAAWCLNPAATSEALRQR